MITKPFLAETHYRLAASFAANLVNKSLIFRSAFFAKKEFCVYFEKFAAKHAFRRIYQV